MKKDIFLYFKGFFKCKIILSIKKTVKKKMMTSALKAHVILTKCITFNKVKPLFNNGKSFFKYLKKTGITRSFASSQHCNTSVCAHDIDT